VLAERTDLTLAGIRTLTLEAITAYLMRGTTPRK
jgi:hypothetical protein